MANEKQWKEFINACARDLMNGELAEKDVQYGAQDHGGDRDFMIALKSACERIYPSTVGDTDLHLQILHFATVFNEALKR